MHLLARQQGTIADGSEAIDLAQSPGEVIVLSAADSELAALARAHDRLGDEGPSLRLVNLLSLGHNLSIDLYVERTLRHAKLVVLRLLGGASYWSYGLDSVVACCCENGIKLAVMPGDAQLDATLLAHGSVREKEAVCLWRYLAEGGPENAENFLRACAHLMGDGEQPGAAQPLLKAGIYWPGIAAPGLNDLRGVWQQSAPVVLIAFYRALIEGHNVAPVDALIKALATRGVNALPVYLTSLKDDVAAATLAGLLGECKVSAVLNATGFAVSAYDGDNLINPFAAADCPVLQLVFSGSGEEMWRQSDQGLAARDLAMNVVLPELDGRIMTRAVSFKAPPVRHDPTDSDIVTYQPVADRIDFVAALAANWVRLRKTATGDRHIAIVLANYPNRDGRIGNGVGYDTPASTLNILRRLREEGYDVRGIPENGNALIDALLEGPTNRTGARVMQGCVQLTLTQYRIAFERLPGPVREQMSARWGAPEDDPFFRDRAFHLGVRRYGNVLVAIQPARGYNIDPAETYHDPALIPPHGYLAFYVWLREVFGAHAVIHNGKHGNLEWLPGKAVALSQNCFPEAMLGPLPHFYPFIVNDPGEGTQAKRRASAVIIDHLTPPLTRAETYGPLKDLEALIDEYYLASGLDPRRVALLKREILDLTRSSGLDQDAGIGGDADDDALQKLDAYICELKEAQIRDGLHILGEAPQGRLETDLLAALARVPRKLGADGDQSLQRAIAQDLNLQFDPLDCDLGAQWQGSYPKVLADMSAAPWRTCGDSVERIELLAAKLIDNDADCPGPASKAVLDAIERDIKPALRACGDNELDQLARGLDGTFVQPGPSGAPTRGRLDVLPTGRNFFSIDNRAVPTPAAWTLGRKSAELMLQRHFQDHGSYPKTLGLSVWGTSNMRTGGDDIAQALALLGVEPRWDRSSWRVTGFDILPLAALGRPRVDVTLRISGFFRDAFPAQIDLFASAVQAVGALEEDARDNPLAFRMQAERKAFVDAGLSEDEAGRRASYRIFGAKPGAYGAGLQALIDERLWDERGALAESYINWGSYAYGSGAEGARAEDMFRTRLGGIEAVVHNQDNREHDLLDSDDYYQFEGGMSAAVEHVSGARPRVYHNDHSRPERPVIRTLEEEIGRVMRSRVVNPKWIAGVMRHGYKGAFEIAATVDYMFAFAATTGAVRDHHFDLAYQAFIADDQVREFLGANNAPALAELAQRFLEAIDRALWTPRSNRAYHELQRLAQSTERRQHDKKDTEHERV